jgi:hypothetical protein
MPLDIGGLLGQAIDGLCSIGQRVTQRAGMGAEPIAELRLDLGQMRGPSRLDDTQPAKRIGCSLLSRHSRLLDHALQGASQRGGEVRHPNHSLLQPRQYRAFGKTRHKCRPHLGDPGIQCQQIDQHSRRRQPDLL